MKNIIVVTGGAGFIGSNLLSRLEDDGYTDIVCIDSFGDGDKWKNVRHRKYVRFIELKDTFDFLNWHGDDILVIVHLGAISSTTETDVDRLVSNNVNHSIALYEFSRDKSIQFIYASSASVYGNGENGFCDDDDFDLLSRYLPLNPYGWSKMCVDRYILKSLRQETSDSQVVGLRFFNVYGPNEYHKNGQYSVIYKFYLELFQGNTVKLFKSEKPMCKDGEQMRDFVYVGDCVDVIVWMIQHPSISGFYNVGSGQARTFNDVARLVIQNTKPDASIRYVEMPPRIAPHYQYFTEADIAKLRSIGYQREMTSLENGIGRYVNEFLKTSNTIAYEPYYL